MSALTSGRYHIKWTELANLPVPMIDAHVMVQDKKIYVAGGASPVVDAQHPVHVYDINTDHWNQLPNPGHYLGVPYIIGGKLSIVGGFLSATKIGTNKVSTFDETSQTWTSYYPNLLSTRIRPGVVTHLEHAIVAGGIKFVGKTRVVQDDIEVLNWMENSHWQKASVILPVPMATFAPIIMDDHLLIVGYTDVTVTRDKSVYKILIDHITKSCGRQQTSYAPTEWITMIKATHYYTALVPSSSPPVVVGGCDRYGVPTSAIKMYDDSSKSWKNVASLSSARSEVVVAAVSNNAIIVIGGCTKGGIDASNAKSSSLTTVELGQAQLMQ